MSSPIELLPSTNATITIAGTVSHLCPFEESIEGVPDTHDSDHVQIQYVANQGVIEANSWYEYLASFAQVRITIEDLTMKIKTDLRDAGIELISIVAEGTHAGVDIRVER